MITIKKVKVRSYSRSTYGRRFGAAFTCSTRTDFSNCTS